VPGSKKWKGVRKSLCNRDGERCHYCGDPLTPETSTVDHKVPRAHGGANDLTNLVLACQPCNAEKGEHSYGWFVQYKQRGGGGICNLRLRDRVYHEMRGPGVVIGLSHQHGDTRNFRWSTHGRTISRGLLSQSA
jgi:hypothetical protein